jgi:hypothetical protein
MTNSESIYQFGPNAYGKPATALSILRETVMGRDLFDYAFKEYSRRWAFKHPTPADFFRTMEDASGVDLDWFWRGWFYTNDHCDLSIDRVKWMQIDTQNPDAEAEFQEAQDAFIPANISHERDVEDVPVTYLEADSTLNDYYTTTGKYEVLELDRVEYEDFLITLNEEEKAMLVSGKNFYEITFKNIGGLVMPLIIQFEYEDGTTDVRRIPAEIWLMSEPTVTKVFQTDRPATRIVLDPYLETADCDLSNNSWPHRPQPTRFQIFKDGSCGSFEAPLYTNPMQKAIVNEELLNSDGE